MKETDTDVPTSQTLANAKKAIDNLVNSCGGLLVLTVHFNEWINAELTWDTTLDANGYPVGYARFNELAQYAVASGCQIMTAPRALEVLDK